MRLLSLLLGLCIAMLLTVNSPAEAACSGSGTTWSCTAGSTASQINSALSSASNNAVITLAAGSYALGGDINFLSSKGATIICETQGACSVTGGMIGMNGNCSGVLPNLYRISGMVFSGGSTRSWWWGSGTSCTVQQFRIDHNTFTGQTTGQTIMYFGEVSSPNNYFYGVVDHNTITNAGTIYLLQVLNGTNTPTAGALGGSTNIFVEDNTFTLNALTNNGAGFVDGWGGHGVVVRFNTLYNSRLLMHGSQHAWGPINFEVYHNYMEVNSASDGFVQFGNRLVHHQGSGTMMVFENRFRATAGESGVPIVVQHSGSQNTRPDGTVCNGSASIDENRSPTSTYAGYACYRQPARDVNRVLKPIYNWRNRWDGSSIKTDMDCSPYSSNDCTRQVLENREYYNAVSGNAQTSPTSPFNGTTGMGFGTLANRPVSCTTNSNVPDAGRGGVGYWATDVGEWNSTNGTVPDGQLYICSATNTWSLYYKPYTYPHPLQQTGGTGGGAMTLPPAPTNLQVQ